MRGEAKRGGARPGSGPKPSWSGPTTVIRVPIHLRDRVVDVARVMDAGRPVEYDDDTNVAVVRDATALLREEAARLALNRKATPRRDVIARVIRVLESYQGGVG